MKIPDYERQVGYTTPTIPKRPEVRPISAAYGTEVLKAQENIAKTVSSIGNALMQRAIEKQREEDDALFSELDTAYRLDAQNRLLSNSVEKVNIDGQESEMPSGYMLRNLNQVKGSTDSFVEWHFKESEQLLSRARTPEMKMALKQRLNSHYVSLRERLIGHEVEQLSKAKLNSHVANLDMQINAASGISNSSELVVAIDEALDTQLKIDQLLGVDEKTSEVNRLARAGDIIEKAVIGAGIQTGNVELASEMLESAKDLTDKTRYLEIQSTLSQGIKKLQSNRKELVRLKQLENEAKWFLTFMKDGFSEESLFYIKQDMAEENVRTEFAKAAIRAIKKPITPYDMDENDEAFVELVDGLLNADNKEKLNDVLIGILDGFNSGDLSQKNMTLLIQTSLQYSDNENVKNNLKNILSWSKEAGIVTADPSKEYLNKTISGQDPNDAYVNVIANEASKQTGREIIPIKSGSGNFMLPDEIKDVAIPMGPQIVKGIEKMTELPEEGVLYTSGSGFTSKYFTPQDIQESRKSLASIVLGLIHKPLRPSGVYKQEAIKEIVEEYPIEFAAGELVFDLALLKGLGKVFSGVGSLPIVSKLAQYVSSKNKWTGALITSDKAFSRFKGLNLSPLEIKRYIGRAIHAGVVGGTFSAISELGLGEPDKAMAEKVKDTAIGALWWMGIGAATGGPTLLKRVIGAGVYGGTTTAMSGGSLRDIAFNTLLLSGFEIMNGVGVDRRLKLQAMAEIDKGVYQYFLKQGMPMEKAARFAMTIRNTSIAKAGGIESILEQKSVQYMNAVASALEQASPTWRFSAPKRIGYLQEQTQMQILQEQQRQADIQKEQLRGQLIKMTPDMTKKGIRPVTVELLSQSGEAIPERYLETAQKVADGLNKMQEELGVQLSRADEYIEKGQKPFNSAYRSKAEQKRMQTLYPTALDISAHGSAGAVDIPTTSLRLDQQKVAQAAHNAGFVVEDISKTPDHVHIELPGLSDLEKSGLAMKFEEPAVEKGKEAKEVAAPLRPEAKERVSGSPVQVGGEGWTKDRGTIPGEPIGVYKDKLAVTEKIDDQGNVLYEVTDSKGQSYGIFEDIPTAKAMAEQEFNKLKEAVKVTKVPREQLPVGEGEKKASRLEERVKNIIQSATDVQKLEISSYNEMNKAEQMKAASQYVTESPDEALDVLKGKKSAPEGLLYNSIALALEAKAADENDADLILKLASLRSTRAGQEISILTERDPNNPVTYVSELQTKRIKALGEKEMQRKMKSSEMDSVKKEVDKLKPKKSDWLSFIDSIQC